ncbi:MAG: pheromone autoinducer 2 transporter [bacterium ADurb.Bin429]|nr:MAG: pheromone autoinducer 2 transporter [bacterium ADurb.Bin429]
MPIRVRDLLKIIVIVFALVLLIRFLGEIARILLLVALVILFSMMLTPPVSWMERHRVPRAIGGPLVVLAVLGLFTLLMIWMVPPLIEQLSLFVGNLPAYWNQTQAWLLDTTEPYPRAREVLTANEAIITRVLTQAGAVLYQAGQWTLAILGGLAGVVLVVIMTVFTLIKPRPLLNGLFAMLPEEKRQPVSNALLRTAQQMRVYAWSSLLVGLVNGVIVWIGLSFLGVEPALLLAALVFFGEFFPYVGPIAAAIPAIILAFLVSPLSALWTLFLYLGIQQLEASVLSPLIVSRQMKFHPLSVAFTILALGELYGVLGAFLAIPVLATIKAFYEELVLKPRQIGEKDMEPYANHVVQAQPRDEQQQAEES